MSAGQVILMRSWPPVLQMQHLEQMGFDEKFVRQYGSAEYHALWKRKLVSVPPIPMLLKDGDHTKRFPQAKLMEWLETYFQAEDVRARIAAKGTGGVKRRGSSQPEGDV